MTEYDSLSNLDGRAVAREAWRIRYATVAICVGLILSFQYWYSEVRAGYESRAAVLLGYTYPYDDGGNRRFVEDVNELEQRLHNRFNDALHRNCTIAAATAEGPYVDIRCRATDLVSAERNVKLIAEQIIQATSADDAMRARFRSMEREIDAAQITAIKTLRDQLIQEGRKAGAPLPGEDVAELLDMELVLKRRLEMSQAAEKFTVRTQLTERGVETRAVPLRAQVLIMAYGACILLAIGASLVWGVVLTVVKSPTLR